MAKKKAKKAAAAAEPAKPADPIVCEWVKAAPIPAPQPLQFTARELGYLDTLLTVELSVLKPELVNKTMRDAHHKIREEFKQWWDKLETADAGAWSVRRE
jgi:hypothetical protein